MTPYDVMVIGSGFAGMAASLFAANRGLSVVQAGATGGIDFSTGFLDLLAVHPVWEGRVWEDPFAALAALRADLPDHPYCRVTDEEITTALDEFTAFLAAQGLCYTGRPRRNTATLTAAGTIKYTWRLPCSAWSGVEALESRAPALVVDFHGLKGFSAKQIAEVRADWPHLRTARIHFPGLRGELFPEHMAWSLTDPQVRIDLAAAVSPLLGDAQFVGFPAVLGLTDTMEVVRHLEKLLGRRVFEIPTVPPSIAGPRLRAAFDRGLAPLGVHTYTQKLITAVHIHAEGFVLTAGSGFTAVEIPTRAAILATGRFFGKGLVADRTCVREAVFGIPVTQPNQRSLWHQAQFFAPTGHAINQAGIETDESFRPLGADGTVFHPRLYAAGAILAHQDWARMKCGAGLAIATAFKAVDDLCTRLH
jgi:glycerol-3-phosphate dehydrogenase subunit B